MLGLASFCVAVAALAGAVWHAIEDEATDRTPPLD